MDKNKAVKNYGLIIEPLQESDWLFGSSGLGKVVRISDGNWTDLLPTGEKQKRQDTDKMACVAFSACNGIELEFEYVIQNKIISIDDLQWLKNKGYMDENGKLDFSDRFIAIVSNTSKNGNTPKRVAEAIRKYGLIPEKMLPYRKSMSWVEYYNKELISPTLVNMGHEFLERFPINYEFVTGGMKEYNEARKYNPVQVFIHAYNGVSNGIYLRTTYPINHAVLNHNENQIFDSYDPYIKTMASNFIYMYYGTRFIVQFKKEVKKKVMKKEQLDKLYRLGLKREADDLAKSYLNHDIEFVIDELLKSKEFESINKLVKFVRSLGFSLGKKVD